MSQFKNDQKPPGRLGKFRDSTARKYKFEFKTTLKLSKCVEQIRHWHEKCPDNLNWKFKGYIERIGTSDAYQFRIQRSNCRRSEFISELYGSMRQDDFEQKTVIYTEFELPFKWIELITLLGFTFLMAVLFELLFTKLNWVLWLGIGLFTVIAIQVWLTMTALNEYQVLMSALRQKLDDRIILNEIE